MISQYFDIGANSLISSKIEELKKVNSQESIEKVATELEALFIYEMMKAMRKTVNISEKKDDALTNYDTMIDLELSKVLAEKGIGLKKYLLDALSKDRIYQNYQNIKKNTSKITVSEEVKTENIFFKNITSGFGIRKHPLYGYYHFHKGVDIALPEGTDIRPVADGKVVYSGFDRGYGFNVVIEHENGIRTRYAHNMVNLVEEGDSVTKSTVIGKVGMTGVTTGPHIHFEVIKDGEPIDPGTFIANNKLKF